MGKKEDDYRKAFELDNAGSQVTKKALDYALDIRKFEIGLYWQRAAYFWALIAAAFAGYFAILAADKIDDKLFNAYVIACIGFIFSLAWFLVNRGSKFWQENWENHVDMLETGVSGPLYKTILHRPKSTEPIEKWIDGPLPISVSKVNQWVSLFTILVWLVLIENVLLPFDFATSLSIKHIVVAIITLGVGGFMIFKTKSHLGDHKHSSIVKRTSVIDG
jgi:uncharacterized protein YhhL (DUF1145 family)